MKLKWWLLLTHLIVMMMPIISAILLYWIINTFNAGTGLEDYLTAVNRFSTYETLLAKQELYLGYSQKASNIIGEKDKQFVEIELYNAAGQQLFASSGTDAGILGFTPVESLYTGLYNIQTGARAYTLKKPVFKDGTLIGFYKITLAREAFVQGVNDRTILVVSAFGIALILVFAAVMLLLNKKLNSPVQLLIDAMNRYAQGRDSMIQYSSKDEIGELIIHFNRMKKDLEEKNKALQEEQKLKEYMISAVSHDLKTPLTAIRANAEMIAGEGQANAPRIASAAKVIMARSDYMKTMIDDLMTYNLLTTQDTMNFVEVETNELFEMLFAGYDEPCAQSQVRLERYMDVSGGCMADVRQLTRVVDNLMANALRFTPAGGYIRMGAFMADAALPPQWFGEDAIRQIKQLVTPDMLMVIQNDGDPIGEEEKEKIFRPFYQSDDSRNKQKWNGVGLGLSVVKLIVEKHGGEVQVISEEACTTFVCRIPTVQTE